jgi:hypothetical protein
MINVDNVWQWVGSLLLALVSGGGAVGWWKAVKDDQRNERSEPVDLVSRTLDLQIKQSDHMAEMQTRQTALFVDNMEIRGQLGAAKSESAEALRRATHAEAETGRLREALAWVGDHIRPIIEWVDGGAKPPPPPISEELRAYLAGELDTTGRKSLDDLY